MFSKSLSITGIAFAAALAMGAPASATTVTFTKDYGSAADGGAQYGTVGYVNANSVTVRDANDTSGNRFFDFLDFSSITNTINSVSLSLDFSGAKNSVYFGIFPEDWRLYLSTDGSTSSATRLDAASLTNNGPLTYSLTGAALAEAISSKTLKFWFGDEAFGPNNFALSNASVTISAVPLPAAGLLLLGALGGLTAMRRRRASSGADVAA